MPRSFRAVTALGLALAASTIVAGCGSKNAIAEGQPIPNTEIVSCGDALLNLAPPTGTLEAELTVSTERTVLSGKVIWQASCPQEESDSQTEFAIERVTFFRDDAGFPGDKLDSAPLDLHGVVSCSDRATSQIGGGAKSQMLDPTDVLSLADSCAERAKNPTGSPFYVHVQVEGIATNCSSEKSTLLIRTKVGVDCGTP